MRKIFNFLSYLVVFISCAHCVSFQLFCFILNYCKYSEALFQRYSGNIKTILNSGRSFFWTVFSGVFFFSLVYFVSRTTPVGCFQLLQQFVHHFDYFLKKNNALNINFFLVAIKLSKRHYSCFANQILTLYMKIIVLINFYFYCCCY